MAARGCGAKYPNGHRPRASQSLRPPAPRGCTSAFTGLASVGTNLREDAFVRTRAARPGRADGTASSVRKQLASSSLLPVPGRRLRRNAGDVFGRFSSEASSVRSCADRSGATTGGSSSTSLVRGVLSRVGTVDAGSRFGRKATAEARGPGSWADLCRVGDGGRGESGRGDIGRGDSGRADSWRGDGGCADSVLHIVVMRSRWRVGPYSVPPASPCSPVWSRGRSTKWCVSAKRDPSGQPECSRRWDRDSRKDRGAPGIRSFLGQISRARV